MRVLNEFIERYITTTDPNIRARGGICVLVTRGDRKLIRSHFPGCYHLTCKDGLGCYVFVPCDDKGNTLPPPLA